MRAGNLRINELSEDAYAWYLEYLRTLDAKDIDAYAALLAEDVEMIQNNMDPQPLLEVGRRAGDPARGGLHRPRRRGPSLIGAVLHRYRAPLRIGASGGGVG
jgi:hypothetical protein